MIRSIAKNMGTSLGGFIGVGKAVIPTGGKQFFVNPVAGSDGNSGLRWDQAFKTVAKAYASCTTGNNDIVWLISRTNTSSDTTDYQSALLTWGKDATHLIGVCAPTAFSQRARIAQKSSTTGLTTLMSVTGNNCIMSNISIFNGVADATSLVALTVSGQRNYFHNMHIAGMGHASQVTAGAASLKLSGASENLFDHCVIGLDTITRDNTTNGEIWCTASASRNYFEDCDIDAYISSTAYRHVKIDTNGIDRTLKFKNCIFMSKSTNKTIQQASVFTVPAISQGAIVLQYSMAFSDGGATVWDSSGRGIIWNNQVAAAASAGGGIMTNL